MRHVSTAVLTFDQPLWWKAKMILTSKPAASRMRSTALRLGPFHTEMSVLVCIGRLMEGSVCAGNSQTCVCSECCRDMVQGKAVTQATREYFMIDSCLNAFITTKTFRLTLPTSNAAVHKDFNIGPPEPENVSATVLTAVLVPTYQGEDIDEDLVGSLSLFDKFINE
ncbi:hypothetical protein ElyMa_005021100 [Elysia marginata]|uniref:Uncharacterized protein n=1 Tax=Elysia marginata TaxID=1093978 RepID=A0AAV4JC09_9GAST|nr:hypothetical protein ElyMa_005021100 [Elysia marginata]